MRPARTLFPGQVSSVAASEHELIGVFHSFAFDEALQA
ncbi:hypothetical protein SAMN04490183_4623 [Pseudomonas corrugata]|nr:hypothetical protein SAMN04490183_4623 [Pseudomonas corrugata]